MKDGCAAVMAEVDYLMLTERRLHCVDLFIRTVGSTDLRPTLWDDFHALKMGTLMQSIASITLGKNDERIPARLICDSRVGSLFISTVKSTNVSWMTGGCVHVSVVW